MFLKDLLYRQKNNNKIAIRCGDQIITYSDWYKKSSLIAKIISQNNLKEKSNIALFIPNSIDYAVAYFAISLTNKTIIPIGTESKKTEIINTLEYCEIDMIITTSAFNDIMIDVLSNYNHFVALIFIDEKVEENRIEQKVMAKKNECSKIYNSKSDVAIMLHTSGTTSNPKRVMLSHENLIKNIESNIASLNLSENDVTLISMPMYFGYCNTAQFLTHLYLGASIVIMEGVFWPHKFFQLIQNYKISNFTGVPSMLLMLLDYRYSKNYDISNLRYICFGGGNMPIGKLKQLIKKYNTIGFVQTYGQTEAAPRVTALLPEDSIRKIGSVGKAIPNVEVEIMDCNECVLAQGEIGEIVVRGPNVMLGYFKREDLTKKTLLNGWLHTGDLGYIDKDGYLYLTGRKKNIIISGGINIYPEEIEELLMNHPAVSECCVISEQHYLLGEIPIAKIVLKHDFIDSNELYKYCKYNLSNYKIPKRFDFVSELSKTYNGKVKRY